MRITMWKISLKLALYAVAAYAMAASDRTQPDIDAASKNSIPYALSISNMIPASDEHDGFWKVHRDVLLGLMGVNWDDVADIIALFHDNGQLASEDEYRNIGYTLSQLTMDHHKAPTVHDISTFRIQNFTFYTTTRIRHTKDSHLVQHIKYWLQNSNQPYLYLSLNQDGEENNERFKTSAVIPQILVKKRLVDDSRQVESSARTKRYINTDGSEFVTRLCTPGYQGCCFEEVAYEGAVARVLRAHGLNLTVKVCRGRCGPTLINELLADEMRDERCCIARGRKMHRDVTLTWNITNDSGVHRLYLHRQYCACSL